MPDGSFKFLMNYIDHGIKLLWSTPLTHKRAITVAWALVQIFTFIGPPCILQSDNGREFSSAAQDGKGSRLELDNSFLDEIIKEIKNMWPECKMVRGSPRHSQSNGGVERINLSTEKKLGAWMKDNNSTRWAVGCKIVQWRVNTQISRAVNAVPYQLFTGQLPRVGISSLPISSDLLDKLSTEQELNQILDVPVGVPIEFATLGG